MTRSVYMMAMALCEVSLRSWTTLLPSSGLWRIRWCHQARFHKKFCKYLGFQLGPVYIEMAAIDPELWVLRHLGRKVQDRRARVFAYGYHHSIILFKPELINGGGRIIFEMRRVLPGGQRNRNAVGPCDGDHVSQVLFEKHRQVLAEPHRRELACGQLLIRIGFGFELTCPLVF